MLAFNLSCRPAVLVEWVYTSSYDSAIHIRALDTDKLMNVYLIGTTGYEIVFFKLNNQGTLEWTFNFGSVPDFVDQGVACRVDSEGFVYIAGFFAGEIDFDPLHSGGVLVALKGKEPDIFICKYDSYGNLIWADSWDGPHWSSEGLPDTLIGLDFDKQGNVYLLDNLLWIINKDGKLLQVESVSGQSICIDSLGNIIVAVDGFLAEMDENAELKWRLPVGDSFWGMHIFIDSHDDIYADVFGDRPIMKIDTNGHIIRKIGRDGFDYVLLCIDDLDNIYIRADSILDSVTTEADSKTRVGQIGIYINKLNQEGRLLDAFNLKDIERGGGFGWRVAAVDRLGRLYVAGEYAGEFYLKNGTREKKIVAGSNGIFVLKIII